MLYLYNSVEPKVGELYTIHAYAVYKHFRETFHCNNFKTKQLIQFDDIIMFLGEEKINDKSYAKILWENKIGYVLFDKYTIFEKVK